MNVEKNSCKRHQEEPEDIIGVLLGNNKLTLSIAESCTGGLVSQRITNIPGSSNYFEGGVIAYSNKVKIEVLKVPSQIIKKYGAVSKETAIAMADGVRNLMHTSLGLSVTGIAGPTGGTDRKPVGLVFAALADGHGVVCQRYNFNGDRLNVKFQASQEALDMVKEYLIKFEMVD